MRFILHLEHSESVPPLAIGNVAAFSIPLELVEDDVFGRGDQHLGSSFVDLDTSPPFDLVLGPGVSTHEEDVNLEHGGEVDHIEGRPTLDSRGDSFGVGVKVLTQGLDQGASHFDSKVGDDIGILCCARDADRSNWLESLRPRR